MLVWHTGLLMLCDIYICYTMVCILCHMLRHMLLYDPLQSDLWCLYDDVYHMVLYVMPYDAVLIMCQIMQETGLMMHLLYDKYVRVYDISNTIQH